MGKIQIMIEMGPPEGPSKYPPREPPMSVEEQVRQAIDCIESGNDSYVEWKLLNKLADSLRNSKKPRAVAIMKMIDPVMSKYGMHGVSEEPNK